MAFLHKLPTWTRAGKLMCVVESPRGSKAKFKYEPELGVFLLSRSLILGVNYPYDWGFIPSTKAPDGDPLDVMVFHDTPTYPGVVMECDVIGALLVTQKKSKGRAGREPNHRLFAVPAGSERHKHETDARKLPTRVRKELESFFIAVGLLANKELKILEWAGPEAAEALVKDAELRWRHSPDGADGRRGR